MLKKLKLLKGLSVQPHVKGNALKDEDLMKAVARSDQRAFEVLFNRYNGKLMSWFYAMKPDRAWAEEMTQETFLKIYRVRETYQTTAAFTTWMFTIGRHTALDSFRKKSEVLEYADYNDPESQSIFEDIESETESAEVQLLEQIDQKNFEDCYSKLSSDQREILALRTQQELSYQEIADQMHMTLPGLKTQIHRAKKSLMTCLQKKAAVL